jgi:hypothetical protein
MDSSEQNEMLRPLIGYLLTCARTGAWRGSV